MTLFEAVILGIVQGITEFLPISSSAHLVLVPRLFGWQDFPLLFDTSLHLGTMAAILIYFYKDLISINKRMLGYLFAGSFPILLFGFLFGDLLESIVTIKSITLFMLLGTLLMGLAELLAGKISKSKLDLKRALVIGISEMFSLFSGLSRSGVTISSGMLSGLSRAEAAKFSFLLSSPAVFAAGAYQLAKSYQDINVVGYTPFAAGVVTSFISGYLCISVLLRFLKTQSLWPFVIYRLLLVGFLFYKYF